MHVPMPPVELPVHPDPPAIFPRVDLNPFSTQRSQFYALYSSPELYFLNLLYYSKDIKKARLFVHRIHSINETAYLDR